MLEIEQLEKVYLPPKGLQRAFVRVAASEPVCALRSVSFVVEPGEVVGLVGPNGAGKTTLIKIIGTLLEPSAGRATIDGHDVVSAGAEVRRRIGLVLAEDRGLYWRLTGRQNLEFFGVLAGLPRPAARERADEMLARVELTDVDKLVFGYSTGMRSRLNLARALLGEPSLLILDEPTRSLDPFASERTGQLLRGLAAEGRAVLLSSHRLDEVATVCDRVVVMVDGEARYVGSTDYLRTGSDPVRSLAQLLARDETAP